jgi:rod shape-determining protein MreD
MTSVRRVIGIPLTLLIAVIAQVAVVNRMPLPGGAAPDLVLLAVAALGAMLGPSTGMIAGFCGGLALDIAPPAGHVAGVYALVFCLTGYACGRMRDLVDPTEEHATLVTVTVMAIGAAGGEAAKAVLGLMMSNPDMAGPAVRHVLPGAILYDLLLTPFVLVMAALAVARRSRSNAPGSHERAPRIAAQHGAVRTTGSGAAPRLRLGGGPTALTPKATVRPAPRLRLAGSISPALSRTDRGAWAGRPVSVNFSSGAGWSGLIGGGALGGGRLGPSLFAPNPLRGGGKLGKGWLKNAPTLGAAAPRGLAGGGPGKGWLKAGPAVAKKTRAGSPGKGWLKGSGGLAARAASSRPRGSGPGRGWLKGSPTFGKRKTYQSKATPSFKSASSFKSKSHSYQSKATPFRRRRRIRLGGRR